LRIKIALILWGIVALVGGCGLKTVPVPWEKIVPRRIVDLKAISREGRLLLEWTCPKENTDRSLLTNLVAFQILRSEGTLVAGECKGCGGEPVVVFEKEVGKENVSGKKISIFLDDQKAGKVYVYRVISINRRGHRSAPSNPVTVYWDDPPQPPKTVRGEAGDKRVDLYWEPVEGTIGYNIYRRGEEEKVFPLSPLNREPLTATQYTDLSVDNEKKYIYSVRAVKRVVSTDVEGKGSPDTTLTPTALIPPSAPLGLVAIPLKNGIELNWSRNREPDLLGYYIYRRRPGEREFKKLNETPLGKEVYLDTHVELDQDYEYAVTAVDNSVRKNESPFSEEVRVKYLY